MGKEIERKFRVVGSDWKSLARPTRYRQGYLSKDVKKNVRVREAGDKAFLTVKSAINHLERSEFEYEIPLADAHEMFALCEGALVEKLRYRIPISGHLWEVDEFLGSNQGLVIAEIELERVDEEFLKPDWLGEEVSHDPRYLNSSLAFHPFQSWAT